MFHITEPVRTTALWACLVAIAALILGLGASLIDPTSPLFRGAVFVGAAFGFIAVMVVLAGAVNAREARPRAHARAEPKPPADCTTCGEPGCSMPDGPEDSPLVQALAADPELMRQFNDGWPRGRVADPAYLAEQASENRRLTAGVQLMPVTTQAGAGAVDRHVRQQRAAYWHERATAMLEEGNVQGAMADIVRSAADSLDTGRVKATAARLAQDVNSFVHPQLLPSSGRDPSIMELAVLSDTRLYAGQVTGQMARMIEELCDRNAELAGRVVAGIGHSAAAMARANEEAIDPDNPRRELEDVTDGELMQEAIERGLVRMGAEVEPTSGLH